METMYFGISMTCSFFAFLPYLWGMETIFCVLCTPCPLCSYRTYEEWKLKCRRTFLHRIQFLPYLWGMETVYITHDFTCGFSSYRTYEEWKLKVRLQSKKRLPQVLTVPMRNGNVIQMLFISGSWSSYRTYEEWKLYPDRSTVAPNSEFLPYLWGMETFCFHCCCARTFSFLPYLWGMETYSYQSVHYPT